MLDDPEKWLTGTLRIQMKKILSILFCVSMGYSMEAQIQTRIPEGSISFITAQHVYVRFASAEDLAPGDTLYIEQNGKPVAALRISARSSLSCVCDPIEGLNFAVGDKVLAPQKPVRADKPPGQIASPVAAQQVPGDDSIREQKVLPKETVQQINGRISVASFSGFSNTPAGNTERMQYTFSMNARHISGSKFSAESYITFVHRSGEWDKVKENLFNGLKIYNLFASWEAGTKSVLNFGRRINPKFSGLGAVDGIQFEQRFGSFSAGIIGGFRPDPDHYGFNTDLLQYGGYLYQEQKVRHGSMQNTLAFMEQSNTGKTDRRFAYLQHSNTLITNLYFFGSAEFDLYNKSFNTEDSTLNPVHRPKVSNLYLSLRYRFGQKLSLSFSHSARQNIVYYETYRSYLEKLLESETRQGYSFQLNYIPVSGLSVGLNAGYYFQNRDIRDSRNVHGYITYLVPLLKLNTTASFTWIDASYVGGNIYSLGFFRNLIKGKLDAGMNYRYAGYRIGLYDYSLVQHIAEMNLGFRITGRLSLNAYVEGTFEKPATRYLRVYARLSRSF